MTSQETEPAAGIPQGTPQADLAPSSGATADGDTVVVAESRRTDRASSYQELLRAMGSLLDDDSTSTIGIIEVEDGFLLRAERIKQLIVEVSITYISREALAARAEEMRRTRPPSGKRHHPGVWDGLPVTHQDFFRALGYELDSVGARRVVVDEVSDRVLLWFEQEPQESQPPGTRKLSLGRTEIEEILNEAVRRRRVTGDKASDHFYMNWDADDESGAHDEHTDWKILRQSVPYQQLLRGVGRLLDRQGAQRVCVLETADGFAVRYLRPADQHLDWAEYSDEDVQEEGPENRWKPATGLFRKQVSILPHPPGGYSDLFRALGYELQRTDATDIFITEQEDGLAVSYQFRDSRVNMNSRRTMRLLTPEEQKVLTEQARARRQSSGPSRTDRR